MAFLDIETHALELGSHIAPCTLTVIGQEEKRDIQRTQAIDEGIGAADHLAAAIDHAVHIDQVSAFHG